MNYGRKKANNELLIPDDTEKPLDGRTKNNVDREKSIQEAAVYNAVNSFTSLTELIA